MNLGNFRKTIAVSTFALALIFGSSIIANAQRYDNRYERQQKRIYKQQRRAAREQNRYNRMQYRIYRNGSYYNTDSRGANLLRAAVNNGYRQGYRAGQVDASRRGSYGYNRSQYYRNGNYGYQSYVDQNQYRYYFREGFQKGYEDGYYSRSQYGYNSGGSWNILGSILSGILNIQQY